LSSCAPPPPSLDAACAHELKVVVRDFRGYDSAAGPRHPDFEGDFTSYTGIVQPLLGADQKPVYAPAGATPATTSKANFDQWYRDVDGINLRFDDVVLPLTEDPLHPGTFVYDNQMFFPIDGRGWMDNQFATHNYHFTTEIHLQFPYRGGEVFTFRGDDDVFVFINGHLAIDLGGVHPAEMGSVTLDDQAAALGITPGRSYDLDVFQAERHTTESTFRIETTLQCVSSYIVP
jgi:fibro-slime domain-containing protein